MLWHLLHDIWVTIREFAVAFFGSERDGAIEALLRSRHIVLTQQTEVSLHFWNFFQHLLVVLDIDL